METPPPFASRFLFDGRIFEASIEATIVTLQPEIGAVFSLPSEHFQHLIASGEMKEVAPSTPSPVTGKPLAKPWATFLMDAYSRRMLAPYVTYDPPSYRSAMMAFRLCVQRYGRLPQELVVDRGPEFGSVYFESLLSRCFVTKLERPGKPPHFGSVVERLFGTTTTELLNQLRGNTQASKTARQMTREVDSKRLAVWTLERFASRLSEYVHEVYEQMDHPAHGSKPSRSI